MNQQNGISGLKHILQTLLLLRHQFPEYLLHMK